MDYVSHVHIECFLVLVLFILVFFFSANTGNKIEFPPCRRQNILVQHLGKCVLLSIPCPFLEKSTDTNNIEFSKIY